MKAYQRRRLEKLERNRHKRTRQGLTYEQWCQKGRAIYLSVHKNRTNAWFQQKKKRSSSAMALQQQNTRPVKRARTHQLQQQWRRQQQHEKKTTTTTAAPTNAAALAAARNEIENDDDKNNARRSLGVDFDSVFENRNQHHQAAMTTRTSPKKQAAAKREELPSSSDEIEECEEEEDDLIVLDDDENGAKEDQEKTIDMNEHRQTTTMTKSDLVATILPSTVTRKSLQENPSTMAVIQKESSSSQSPGTHQKRLSQQEGPLQHQRQQQSSSLVDVSTTNKSFIDTIFPSKKRHRTTFARSNRLQHQDSNKTLSQSSDNNTGSSAQQKLQDEEASSFLTFEVASSTSSTPQFWALVEGIVTYDTSASRQAAASYWQDLWMDQQADLLPTTGRVLELLPVESKPGRWQAGVVRLVHTATTTASADDSSYSSSNNNNSKSKTKAVPCRLGLLRESEQDWRNKRVVLRHASLPQTTFTYLTTKVVPAGYTVSVIDPSFHRSEALQQQGALLGAVKNNKNDKHSILQSSTAWTVASLSLVAFEGFSSVAESERHAPILARTVLQACSKDSFWNKRNQQKPEQKRHSVTPPDLMSIPAFGDASSNIPKAATIVQGSGGISLLGNIVDDVRDLDYQILILREEATNQIVGLDVVFSSKESSNLSPSSTNTCLSVDNPQSTTLPLTTQNLEVHNVKGAHHQRPSSLTPSLACKDGKSSPVEELLEHEPSAKRRKTSPKSPDPSLSSRSANSIDEEVMSTDELVDSQHPTQIDPPKQPPVPTIPVTGSHNKKTCPTTMTSTTTATTTSEEFEPVVSSSNAEKTEVRKPAEGLPRITPTPAATATLAPHTTGPGGTVVKVPRRLFTEKQALKHAGNNDESSSSSSDYYHAHEEEQEAIADKKLFDENTSNYNHAREEEQEAIADKKLFDENASDYYDAHEEEKAAVTVVDGEMIDANESSDFVSFHEMMYGGLKTDELEASRDELLALTILPRAHSKFALVNLMQQCSDILYEGGGYSEDAQVPTLTWIYYYWILPGLLLALFSPALLFLFRLLLQGPHSLCFGTSPIVFDEESYFPDVGPYRLESFFTEEDVSFVFLLFANRVIGPDYRYHPLEYSNETRPSS